MVVLRVKFRVMNKAIPPFIDDKKDELEILEKKNNSKKYFLK